MATLGETVRYLRSKNAGPFWLTVDAFCCSKEDTDRVADCFTRNRETIAKMFAVTPDLIKIFALPEIQVVKLSFPRRPVEGSRDERDMHGGQQYVSLLDLEV
ncbi:DUF4387 domain-containing protein [Acidaminococcus sp. NSJ-142]|jgi:hypothetical protein|uniref:DUF4387 family protein n=1 Tax=Acidaminococcus TaxID=904 RepID=UPI000CF9DCE8|nr:MULTISPECIES: DUF4387 family protein [Acidaminococcus]MCD2434571.1 DUF4387 domain-containing protein [Acidaminococcus hominis]MCH4096961.1 DUF4387 domain-containing protein [Acidaminococcus provencensis]RHK03845.1 DUF4387 domain-containing protein [Acidaminococcus sp. AM05-11]